MQQWTNPKWLKLLFGWILLALRQVASLPRLLDWLISVAERLVVLLLFGVAVFIGYRLVTGTATDHEKKLVTSSGENWKTFLLLLLPLFYLTVRKFLEEVQEAF